MRPRHIQIHETVNVDEHVRERTVETILDARQGESDRVLSFADGVDDLACDDYDGMYIPSAGRHIEDG